MSKSMHTLLFFLLFLFPIKSVYAVSNVQHSVDDGKVTITYQGTPPFLINIRGDTNIGQSGGYLWAKTNANSFTYDLGFANNPSKKFYYAVKDTSWSIINSFNVGPVQNNRCEELIGNHNKLNADRINLVFVLIDFPDKDYIVNFVKDNLGFDNGTQIFHIAPYDYFSSKENVWVHVNESNSLFFTMFAIEPLKSNKDKFNFWYYYLNTNYDQSALEDFLNKNIDSSNQYNLNEYLPSCGMKYVAPIVIQAHPLEEDLYSRQSASLPSFFNSPTIDKSNLKFGLFYDYYGINSSGTILSSYNEQTSYVWMHESSHSIFGLMDEYPEDNDNFVFGYPNCAPNSSEAKKWWNDFEGQIDSNYYDLNQIVNNFYNSNPRVNVKPNILCTPEDIRVEYIYGGCRTYLDSKNVIRPNKDSMMVRASNCPIPGMINRDRMEQLLSLFSGD